MAFELEPFGDILPESTTRDSNDDGAGSLSPLEMPTLLASNNKDIEENFCIPACSSFDSLALRTCDAAEPHTCPSPGTTQETVSCREAPDSNKDGDIQVDNGRLETKVNICNFMISTVCVFNFFSFFFLVKVVISFRKLGHFLASKP